MTNLTITYSQDRLNFQTRLEPHGYNLGILKLAASAKLSFTKTVYAILRESVLGQIFIVLISPANITAREVR